MISEMGDIRDINDIEWIMRKFYSQMLQDETLGYIFTDIAKIDLESHLPSLSKFWDNLLFEPNGYQKNVMQIHLDLNDKEKLQPKHFKQWLALLEKTVADNYKGEKADLMLNRARTIAMAMQSKM